MDDERFDSLTRGLAGAASRRSLLGGLAGLLAATVLAAPDAAARRRRRCLKNGTRCTAHSGARGDNCRRCCSGSSVKRRGGGRRCVCAPEGIGCATDAQCCNKQCTGGVCGPCAPGQKLCPEGCVNPRTDSQNCGACGTTCAATQTCVAGACEDKACGAGGPCRVFVSSTTHDANYGGLTGADASCQQLAEAANLPGTYRAWLSSLTESPSTRFTPSAGPYQLVDGTVIATDWADLIDGALAAPINLDETGTTRSANNRELVWTATSPNGTLFTFQRFQTCSDWTNGSGSEASSGGNTAETDDGWTVYFGGANCSGALRLYCFQQS